MRCERQVDAVGSSGGTKEGGYHVHILAHSPPPFADAQFLPPQEARRVAGDADRCPYLTGRPHGRHRLERLRPRTVQPPFVVSPHERVAPFGVRDYRLARAELAKLVKSVDMVLLVSELVPDEPLRLAGVG